MHSLFVLNWIISILIIVDYSSASIVCNCANQTLCQVIPVPDKVVLGFSLGFDNYKLYDWNRINTIVPFTQDGKVPIEFICYAHSYGVSVLIPPYLTKEVVLNVSKHTDVISDILKNVQTNVVDGVNFDFELPLTSDESKFYTMLVSATREALRSINNHYQVSVDVAWSPDCIDQRCYDNIGLSQASDYLVIMAYDEQSQMAGPPCYATANSPFNQTASGISSYLKSGISPSRLVLGLPWYGYNYTCLSLNSHNHCQIQEVSFRGSPCSDAAGHQLGYGYFMNLLQNDENVRKWSSDTLSPYIMLYSHSLFHQIWYDDPSSLGFKYNLARTQELRGIGIWNIDLLDYSDTPQHFIMRKEMWEALDIFSNIDQEI